MKDAGVLGVAFFQRVFNDRESEYPLIFLCNVACSLSAIFIYLVAVHYWGSGVGLLVFSLFIFSFWPYEITLQGTYQCLALLFLLVSVFCLQRYLYLVAGVAAGLMMFSSAATRKFLPLIVGAFLYHFFKENGQFLGIFQAGLGFAAVFLFLTAPHVIQNLKGYWSWWNNSKSACHFVLYKKYFEAIGKPISNTMRGAGWKWIYLFFFRMAPFHSIAFLIAVGLVGYVWWKTGYDSAFALKTVLVLLLSLSPILYGEWTRAPQLARSYFPGFPSMLIFIGFSAFHFDKIFSPPHQGLFWEMAFVFIVVSAIWNVWVFLNDIWPARMAATFLGKKIRKLGLKKIYTYDTPFNVSFIDVLSSDIRKNCEIKFIRSLSEVEKGGYVAVPGISAKAFHMECYPEAIDNKDFEEDPVLVNLIDSKKITALVVASFRTFGTSKIWVQESEMPTYRSLILKDISENDRWRGRAWLLHV
ncbi:MAG: hypothetical protein HY877_01280 [Deltaproteobacteria bacterium]|nr:hypothetical protein [Deltaproteobacteria bacterium]